MAEDVSGGKYAPDSRKDFIFDIRRREEAEGESRIIGSGLRDGFLECVANRPDGGAETAVGSAGRRVRVRNISADLRTWEKS